jgi:hypothetical protein
MSPRKLIRAAVQMRIPEHLKFSLRGFSAKRMAFGFVFISALIWPLHFWADWKGDEYLTGVSFACMVAAFGFGYFVPRSDKLRFLPAALALLVMVVHFLSCKL